MNLRRRPCCLITNLEFFSCTIRLGRHKPSFPWKRTKFLRANFRNYDRFVVYFEIAICRGVLGCSGWVPGFTDTLSFAIRSCKY